MKKFNFKRGKVAFTLAEVLITIGIIGVVSALVIPTLINEYQKRSTANQLKKTFATLTQAVRLAEEEHGEMAGWTMTETGNTQANVFEKFIAPFLKATRTDILGKELYYKNVNGTKAIVFAILQDSSNASVFTLLSGVQFLVLNNIHASDSEPHVTVFMDLNGYKTLPNRLGRDLFVVTIMPEDGVKFAYKDDAVLEADLKQRAREELLNGPSLYNNNCNKNGVGVWCGAVIQQDGWVISKDYPW